ncbi:unnamed protein product [Merluccius merluccius]
MGDSLPFSVLNERLRPAYSALERLRAPPSIWESRHTASSLEVGPSVRRCDKVYQRESEPETSMAQSSEEADDSEMGSLDSDGSMTEDQGNREDLLSLLNQCLVPAMRITDLEVEQNEAQTGGQGSMGSSDTESTGADGSQDSSTAKETGREADPQGSAGDGGDQHQRSFMDQRLPDLIRGSGRPLSRRRTLGPVSDTLKEVRREVEMSRRRSIRLKAQVDKLQEDSDSPRWSQQKERVTEEVLSILRLLHPLTQPQSALAESSPGANRLDAVLSQLQTVARTLAISHGKETSGVAKRSEDMAILEQALRDRDEAIERKKGMEAELLRSKTELMCLNNQLLEAVQKRLELSLELEAWKEDLQYILQQQLQQQSQHEAQAQAQKKSRVGLLRRADRVLVQRPVSSSTHPPTPAPTTKHTPTPPPPPPPAPPAQPPTKSFPAQGFGSLSRAWKDKFRRGKTGRQEDEQAGQNTHVSGKDMTGFQTVSLD